MTVIDTMKKHLRQATPDLGAHQVDLLSRLIPALMRCRSVNLMKVAGAMSGPAHKMSRYRRLQRFFSSALSPRIFSQWIVDRLVRPDRVTLLTLTMDRTHWRFGQAEQNLLCLGLLYGGVSIPLETLPLGKAGNSNTQERMLVLRRAWSYLKDTPCCLLADREFIGGEWFAQLLARPEMDFVIRIRENSQVTFAEGRTTDLGLWVRRLPKGHTWYYYEILLYESGTPVHVNLVCHRSLQDEVILLVTNRSDLKQALGWYRQRWSIETTFSCLKSRGFDLEDTHLTHPDRLALLMGVLSWCLLWCVLVGLEHHQRKAIPLKKHGRKAISFVRLGLDSVQEAIHNFSHRWREYRHYCRLLLSCT